jgi:hypothetical protein
MLAVAVAGAVVGAAGFKMVEGVVMHLSVVAEETCRVVPYQRLQSRSCLILTNYISSSCNNRGTPKI